MRGLRCSLLLSALLAALALASACGRSEMDVPAAPGAGHTGGATSGFIGTGSSGGGIGGAGSGTSSVGGTTAGGSGGSSDGACSEIPCLAPLMLGCLPSGTCTSDTTSTWPDIPPTYPETDTYCFSNGVKHQVTITTTTTTSTFKRDNTVCYSADLSAGADSSTFSVVFRDAGGAQIATGTLNGVTSALVVTCNGSQPWLVSDACHNAAGVAIIACTKGWCVF